MPSAVLELERQRGVTAAISGRIAWMVDRVRRHGSPGDTLPLAALSGVSALATVLSPALLAQPLVLVALTPRLPFLVLASTQASLPLFLVVGVARLGVADIFSFRLGRRLGPVVLGRLPPRLRALSTAAPRTRNLTLGALVLVRPIGRHLAAAGAVGMAPRTVGALDVVGTVAYLVAVYLGVAAVLG